MQRTDMHAIIRVTRVSRSSVRAFECLGFHERKIIVPRRSLLNRELKQTAMSHSIVIELFADTRDTREQNYYADFESNHSVGLMTIHSSLGDVDRMTKAHLVSL